MKILYIHQYFNTPSDPGSTRSYWISKELIKNGHDVVMLTTKPGQKKIVEKKVVDQIKVISVRVSYENNMGILRRLLAFFNFMLYATFLGLKEPMARSAHTNGSY